MTKEDLKDLITKALTSNGGSASIVNVARYIWNNNKNELINSGDLLFTWQYDMARNKGNGGPLPKIAVEDVHIASANTGIFNFHKNLC